MNKLVNLYSSVPITNLSIPRVGNMRGITLSVEDIRICLQSHARVEEVIGNKVIPLGFDNYNKDNTPEEVVTTVVPATPVTKQTKPITSESIKDAQNAAVNSITDTDTKKSGSVENTEVDEPKAPKTDAPTDKKSDNKNKK